MWLSDALLGGALLFGLAWLSPADWKRRLALAVGAALIVAAFHALMWPHCLQRLEGVSPEVERLWLSHVREARPIYRHGWQTATIILALPVSGAIGWLLLIWRNRIDREKLRRTLAAAAPGFAATAAIVLADPHRPCSADARGPRRGRAGVGPGADFLVVEICRRCASWA